MRKIRIQSISTLPVAVINQRLAKKYWPGQSAIGQRLRERNVGVGRVDDGTQLAMEETVLINGNADLRPWKKSGELTLASPDNYEIVMISKTNFSAAEDRLSALLRTHGEKQ